MIFRRWTAKILDIVKESEMSRLKVAVEWEVQFKIAAARMISSIAEVHKAPNVHANGFRVTVIVVLEIDVMCDVTS